MAEMNSSSMPYDASMITKSGYNKFPNPFFDIASEYIPANINEIFDWVEYLYMSMGTYRQASRRVVRYFLTELILEGESDDERDDVKKFMVEELKIMQELAQIGDDFLVYGNVFVSPYFPFDRFLICPKCGTEYRDSVIKYTLKGPDAEFHASCLKCPYEGAFKLDDRRSLDRARVKIIRWSPKYIRLRYQPVTGYTKYYWQMPSLLVDKIQQNDHFYISGTSHPILKTAMGAGDSGSKLFEFNDDSIYHLREATLAGVPIYGWGIPPILPNFKLAYYIQILRRYDEAIALDYIIPFRVIYPDGGAGPNQDGMITMAMQAFKAEISKMVASRRMDPTHIQVAPFKIGYQMAGGEGKMLAPKDSIGFALDELLNATGFPAELYKGTLSIQAFPVALRLFEKTWGTMVDGNNDLIRWLMGKIRRHFSWGDVSAKLRSVTLADDLERKALSLQAASGQDISKQTAYLPLGLDYLEEQRRLLEEQKAIQQMQREAQEEEQAQYGGPADGSGDQSGGQGGPGGQPGATPGDISEQAAQTAQNLLFSVPENMRRGELMRIKASNPTLHALVLQKMSEMRQQMASQGQAQMMQQGQQQMKQGAADIDWMMVGYLIADEVLSADRAHMRKLAVAIGKGSEDAHRGFRFIYHRQRGWL